ncbi:MAG: hypothetical protein RLZZ511_3237 [Cyanobacteriota bacterium]|jgi:hypothetical protein
MTLKDTLLQELEAADEQLIAETIDWVRSRKQSLSTQPPSGEPIHRGNKLGDLAEFAGTWAGDDLEECLAAVYATRSKSHVSTDHNPFQ